jgi:hypothetical protein
LKPTRKVDEQITRVSADVAKVVTRLARQRMHEQRQVFNVIAEAADARLQRARQRRHDDKLNLVRPPLLRSAMHVCVLWREQLDKCACVFGRAQTEKSVK